MHRQLLLSCLPYLAAIALSAIVLRLLIALSGVGLQVPRLRLLHRDQLGGVQSLSFVLTVPVFIMVMMFIVQLSQITIAKIVVEYAAFAAVRSAAIWIPANLGFEEESANRISAYYKVGEGFDEDGEFYDVYSVEPNGPKFSKIFLAAAQACMPICPSQDLSVSRTHPGNQALGALLAAYRAVDPSSASNPRISARIGNKLAYALENTRVSLEVRHKASEPPLMEYAIPPYPQEFALNEIGFQDQLVARVEHDFALLPGPGRLLARRVNMQAGVTDYGDPEASYGHDVLASRIERRLRAYVYTLSASARLHNEGQKSMLPYIQGLDGWLVGGGPPEEEEDCDCDDEDPPDAGDVLPAEAASLEFAADEGGVLP